MDPRVITRLVGHRGGVMAIAYSPVDGNALASGGEMGEVFIWDVAKGNRRVLTDIHRSGQYGAEVWAVAWAASAPPRHIAPRYSRDGAQGATVALLF